jgi:histidinol-phosphate/aromatic aminotransferase/cobyric acid decarboxylase-like protein
LLKDCVRITLGRPADNDQLLQAVSGAERRSHA